MSPQDDRVLPTVGTSVSIVARSMRRFVTFSESETAALLQLEQRPERIRKGANLVAAGDPRSKPFVVMEGCVVEYRLTSTGDRQVLDVMLPGEIANLRSTILRSTDIFMVAGISSVVSRFSATEFRRLIARHPRLGAIMIWRAAVGRSMLAEHLVDIGRRNASQRLGHRLLELLVRMEMAGASDGDVVAVPLDQATLSDLVGLSVEHTSRTLARLRNAGLIDTKGPFITVLDRERLAELSDFDASYLHPDGFPGEWGRDE